MSLSVKICFGLPFSNTVHKEKTLVLIQDFNGELPPYLIYSLYTMTTTQQLSLALDLDP